MATSNLSPPVPTVLIVEDDPQVRHMAAAVVEQTEANAAEAVCGEDALAYLAEHAPEVGVVFTDLELSGRVDGIDLARIVSLRWPWIKVLMTSGGARIRDVPANLVFLPEPCCATDIRAHVAWEAARARATYQTRGSATDH